MAMRRPPMRRTHAAPLDVELTPYQNEGQGSQRLRRKPRGSEEDSPQKLFSLRVIKWTSLCVVALCLWTATVVSKVSFVSITGRMFNLSRAKSTDNDRAKSILFIQLVFLMLVPEVISLLRCLFWGVIGKTTKKFPWPSKDAIFWGIVTSAIEVAALCGFVFGVASRLPPSLTILVLNGCFSVPIGCYLIMGKLRNLCHHGYQEIPEGSDEDQNVGQAVNELRTPNKFVTGLLTILEILGFLVQLGVLVVAIPALSPIEEEIQTLTVIIMPVSLVLISLVWSGWVQRKISKSYDETQPGSARLKAGLLTSAIRIFLIPFVSYLYASVVLKFDVTLHSHNFVWHDLELSTFLTHVLVSFAAFVFAWIASALQSWAFLIPMLLSTPISFVWYVGCIEGHAIFPFVDEYYIRWNVGHLVLIIASLLWISQYLAFGYHIFQNSDNILTNDADLFWMPRYNSVFLEQHLVLNRKTAITGYSSKYSNVIQQRISQLSKDNYVFICSTMYHENETEMTQLLKSINRVAKSSAEQNKRNHKYESHIFFDDACIGDHINKWVMQLLGLLDDILGIKPDKVKLLTPYGIQLKYNLRGGEIPFYIHLKDNSKVKRKKRWSQVMYMNYIINHRIDKDNIMKDKAFILTTDADVNFTVGSVIALLDILACDDGVGAVCARTHPQGNGPIFWYQIFDYAIGHWLQKAAEHILGSVLCCPGCFSVFRVSALKDVLNTFGTCVDNGYDFITKDMGEDRWLCTLLIQEGWRLEYSAISQDSTYCPNTFEEFYKQRRRWITSTLANITLVIGNSQSITTNNDSVNLLFMFYQLLIVFSTLIAPATVIILIVIGLKVVHVNLDDVALVVVLIIVSTLYGALCLYATEKTQIMGAKILTFVFSIIMAVVISGIVTNSINSFVDGNLFKHRENYTETHFQFPVDISVSFTSIIILLFFVAGIFHIGEFYCVFHMFWYLLGLPSAYLFLIIYSICNINNEKWGTREEANPKSVESLSWTDYFFGLWHKFVGLLCRCIKRRQSVDDLIELIPPHNFTDHIVDELHPYVELRPEVKDWLCKTKCDKFYQGNFEIEGYTELDFIAVMTVEDFEAIGIDKRGFQLKLEKAAKKLETPEIQTNVPKDVAHWLKNLKLPQYEELFESEGYSTDEDVENLKGLTEMHLRKMGITRRVEIRINQTRVLMDRIPQPSLFELGEDKAKEHKFWHDLTEGILKPESSNLGKVREVKEDLKELRNYFLLILLLANVFWIAFLYSLTFDKLEKYNLPKRAFSLFFLVIFTIIVLIQFIAMLVHRFVTLLHLLAGIRSTNNDNAGWIDDDVEVVTMSASVQHL